jgi:hypothetical protein
LARFVGAPIVLAMCGIIYPFGTMLLKWTNLIPAYDARDVAANCIAFPPEPFGAVLLTLIVVLGTWALLLKQLNSGIQIMLFGVIAVGAYGVWFFALTAVFMFCPPLPGASVAFPFFVITFVALSAVIFLVRTRHSLPKVLELNRHKWDFEKMQYSIEAPTRRLDGKSMSNVTTLMVLGGFLGIFLANLSVLLFSSDKTLAVVMKDWFTVIVDWVVAFLFIGYLSVGQAYVAWLVYKKCQAAGRKMTVKEFSGRG